MNAETRDRLMKLASDAYFALSVAEDEVKNGVEDDERCEALCDQLFAIRQSIQRFENGVLHEGGQG